jgi:NADPH:quinone reductase-like Zn-dependent oxidoreductase
VLELVGAPNLAADLDALAFGHEVVLFLAGGRARGIVDRVFPAMEAAEAFDYIAQPGKFGKVLLGF